MLILIFSIRLTISNFLPISFRDGGGECLSNDYNVCVYLLLLLRPEGTKTD